MAWRAIPTLFWMPLCGGCFLRLTLNEHENGRKAICERKDDVALDFMAQGSTGNVIAALASFFIPGLGQLLQGRILAAIFYFVLSGVIWVLTLGFLGVLGHVVACLDAAMYNGRIKESL